jgi:hypothetical protein
MRLKLIIGLIGVLLLSPIISGCLDDQKENDRNVIGKEGGIVRSDDGNLKLIFAAGTLSDEEEITVEEISPTNSSLVEGTVYKLGPSGISFTISVDLTIVYDESKLGDDVEEGDLRIARSDGTDWTIIDSSTVDDDANTVSAEISGFSEWGIMRPVRKTNTTSPPDEEIVMPPPVENLGAPFMNSDFQSTATGDPMDVSGWDAVYGDWKVYNESTTTSMGHYIEIYGYKCKYEQNRIISTRYSTTVSDFNMTFFYNYQYEPHSGIYFRGVPDTTGEIKEWRSGYKFEVQDLGIDTWFSIARIDGGEEVFLGGGPLKYNEDPEKKFIFSIVCRDDEIFFFHEGILNWHGVDDTYGSGKLGFWGYNAGNSVNHTLVLDWAKAYNL